MEWESKEIPSQPGPQFIFLVPATLTASSPIPSHSQGSQQGGEAVTGTIPRCLAGAWPSFFFSCSCTWTRTPVPSEHRAAGQKGGGFHLHTTCQGQAGDGKPPPGVSVRPRGHGRGISAVLLEAPNELKTGTCPCCTKGRFPHHQLKHQIGYQYFLEGFRTMAVKPLLQQQSSLSSH